MRIELELEQGDLAILIAAVGRISSDKLAEPAGSLPLLDKLVSIAPIGERHKAERLYSTMKFSRHGREGRFVFE